MNRNLIFFPTLSNVTPLKAASGTLIPGLVLCKLIVLQCPTNSSSCIGKSTSDISTQFNILQPLQCGSKSVYLIQSVAVTHRPWIYSPTLHRQADTATANPKRRLNLTKSNFILVLVFCNSDSAMQAELQISSFYMTHKRQ